MTTQRHTYEPDDLMQLPIMTPEQELAFVRSLPDGAYLSPAAQALNEAQGAERLAKQHPILRRIFHV